MQTEIEFAGVEISQDGYKLSDEVVHSLRNFPKLTSITDVRSFVGLANQLRPYDAQMVNKLEPIRHLLKQKDKQFEMTR